MEKETYKRLRAEGVIYRILYLVAMENGMKISEVDFYTHLNFLLEATNVKYRQDTVEKVLKHYDTLFNITVVEYIDGKQIGIV